MLADLISVLFYNNDGLTRISSNIINISNAGLSVGFGVAFIIALVLLIIITLCLIMKRCQERDGHAGGTNNVPECFHSIIHLYYSGKHTDHQNVDSTYDVPDVNLSQRGYCT